MNSIIVVSGISACGKTYLIDSALNDDQLNLKLLYAVTTRKPRDDEHDGVGRKFITIKEFDELEKTDQLFCVNVVFGNKYAYLKKDVFANLECSNLILDLKYEFLPNFPYRDRSKFVYIFADDIHNAMNNLLERNKDDYTLRFAEAIRENNEIKQLKSPHIHFNYYFHNDFTLRSCEMFKELLFKILHE